MTFAHLQLVGQHCALQERTLGLSHECTGPLGLRASRISLYTLSRCYPLRSPGSCCAQAFVANQFDSASGSAFPVSIDSHERIKIDLLRSKNHLRFGIGCL
jgi:hypothetical protein